MAVVLDSIKYVQIQLETIPPYGARILFYSWYAVLFIAFVLQLGTWQWECTNICGDGTCNLRRFSWTSTLCARLDTSRHIPDEGAVERWQFGEAPLSVRVTGTHTATKVRASGQDATDAMVLGAAPSSNITVTWHGAFSMAFNTQLNRFVHFVLSMPRPTDAPSGTLEYSMTFIVRLQNLTLPADSQNDFDSFKFVATIFFLGDNDRSETITLPTSTTSVSNSSNVVLIATDVPVQLVNVTEHAAIAAVYQNADYTIATIVVRYLLLVFVISHLSRSAYHNVSAVSGLSEKDKRPAFYEQGWVLALQIFFILYLNPLFAAGVFITPTPGFFAFLEFRIPLYFVTFVVSFMFALITSATAWTSRAQGYPPIWTQVLNATLVVTVIVLDLVDAGNADWDWGLEHCPNFKCSTVGYLVYSVIIVFVLACAVWLRYLSNNLGKKPYLSSRPQQLAMRLFIFIFTTYAIYFVLSSVVVVAIYQGFAAVLTYQGLLQLGVLCVSFTFVTIMTFAFTYVLRNEGVPIHPADARWKRVAWPVKWFHWVAIHGGSGYIFFNEAEEAVFNRIQRTSSVRSIDTRFEEAYAAPPPELPIEAASSYDGASTRATSVATAARDAPESDDEWSDAGAQDDDTRTLLGAAGAALRLPGQILRRFEDGIVETAINFNLLSGDARPFFNLETCIDCLNLAWEAYGVPVSAGDAAVTTGVDFHVIMGRLCCCCAPTDEPGQAQDEEETSLAGSPLKPAMSYVDYSPQTPRTSGKERRASATSTTNSAVASPLIPPAARQPEPLTRGEDDSELIPINTEKYGYDNVAVYVGLDVQVVISVMDTEVERHRGKEGRIAVAFRGTDNLSNAVQDVRIAHEEFDDMLDAFTTFTNTTKVLQPRVHSGFLGVWNALRAPVVSKVAELRAQQPNARLMVTGHSLGGAIATLCAYTLYKEARRENYTHPVPVVYTFGMPRVGNSVFRAEYNKRVPGTFRVVNESDAVSHLSIMGGAHVGCEVDVDRYGNYIVDPMFIERMFRPTKGRGSAIAHHSLNGYAASLNSITVKSGLGVCPSRALDPYVDMVMPADPAAFKDMHAGVNGSGDSPDAAAAPPTVPLRESPSVVRVDESPQHPDPTRDDDV